MVLHESAVMAAAPTAEEIISREKRKLQSMDIYEPFERKERKKGNRGFTNLDIPLLSKDKNNTAVKGSEAISTSLGGGRVSIQTKTNNNWFLYDENSSETSSGKSAIEAERGTLEDAQSGEDSSRKTDEKCQTENCEDDKLDEGSRVLSDEEMKNAGGKETKDKDVKNCEEMDKMKEISYTKQESNIHRLRNEASTNFPDSLKYKRLVKLFHNSLNNTNMRAVRTTEHKKVSPSIYLGREVKPLPTVTLPLLRRGYDDNPSIVLTPSVKDIDSYASTENFQQRGRNSGDSREDGQTSDEKEVEMISKDEEFQSNQSANHRTRIEYGMSFTGGEENNGRFRAKEYMVRRPGPLLPILTGIKKYHPDFDRAENKTFSNEGLEERFERENTLPFLDPLEIKGERCMDKLAKDKPLEDTDEVPGSEKKRLRLKLPVSDYYRGRATEITGRRFTYPEKNLVMKRQLSKLGCSLPPLLYGAHKRNRHVRIQDNTNFVKTKLEYEAKSVNKTPVRVPIYSLLDNEAYRQHVTFVTW